MVAGGSYGGFIALEYAVRYPDRVSAIVLRDTSADGSNLELAFENARNQDRVEIDWERFNRYWNGKIRDDADLKALLGGADPALRQRTTTRRSPPPRSRPASTGTRRTTGASSTTGGAYDLKADLPAVTVPTLVTVGRADWVTPVSSSETIASLMPNAELVVFENSGHSPQVEERELFQADDARLPRPRRARRDAA